MGIVIKTYDVGRADCFLIDLDGFLLLVDGGYAGTMSNIIKSNDLQDLDGIILTHIDCDHISGIISLLENDLFREKILKKDNFFVVFNEYIDPSTISYQQGVRLRQLIGQYSNIKLINVYSENQEMEIKGRRVILKCVEKNIACINEGSNNIVIKFISPTKEILRKFMKNWKNRKEDASITNESSIVFLISYKNKNILMTGDSSTSIFQKKIFEMHELKKIDVIKLPHHGSRNGNNNGILKLIEKYKCKKVIVSTKENDKDLDIELIKKIEKKIMIENVVYSYNLNSDDKNYTEITL
jgi:metallo-beta-lactamase family protein